MVYFRASILAALASALLLFSCSCARRVDGYVGKVKDQRASEILEAVRKADTQAIKKILDSAPALVNVKDSAGYTPLHWAVIDGRPDVVELLIIRGAEVNARTGEGITPLHNAARSGQDKVLAVLIAHGGDVNAIAGNGVTPLKLAIDGGHREATELLRYHAAHL